MRRLFIMRKDLNMSPGKLSAQVSHCAEAYWMHIIKSGNVIEPKILDNYVNGSFTKTICSAKNKYQLLKAKDKAIELGLIEGEDFGCIYDNCLTELIPEESNGTTLTGIWFKPLEDDISREISKKYQLYK